MSIVTIIPKCIDFERVEDVTLCTGMWRETNRIKLGLQYLKHNYKLSARISSIL